MIYKCTKCNKNFTSEYLLKKHENRKIPCDGILECVKCLKIFSTIQSLDQHYKRLTPCISEIDFNKRLKQEETQRKREEKQKKQEEKEQRKREEKELEKQRKREEKEVYLQNKMTLLRLKNELDLENKMKLKELNLENKMKLKEKDLENKENILKIKKESNITYINMYAENNEKKIERIKAKDLEIIDAKAASKKQIEMVKTERKGQTAQVINNNITINNTNICINHIKDTFMEYASLSVNSMKKNALSKYNNTIEHLQDKEVRQKVISIFKDNTNLDKIVHFLIKYSYNNEDYPEERCVFYMNNRYFGIYISDSENIKYDFEDDESKFEDAPDDIIFDVSKNVKEIDFMYVLLPMIKEILQKYIETLLHIVDLCCKPKNDSNDQALYNNLESFLKYSLHDNNTINWLKNISDKVFETIIPEKSAVSTIC
jgi:hypothetical protein